MKSKTQYQFFSFFFGLSLLLFWLGSSQAEENVVRKDNMVFRGTLVADACTLWPEDTLIDVDFGSIIDRYLYVNTRTPPKSFAIRLKDCDTTLNKTMMISFTGNENSSLRGMLALDNGSDASGIAIGLETSEGEKIIINKNNVNLLHDGENILQFQAYIQGEPDAIKARKIEKGAFMTTATFNISYE